jgi:hypothetical protein
VLGSVLRPSSAASSAGCGSPGSRLDQDAGGVRLHRPTRHLGEFRPEYVGKLGFYLAAVDDLVRGEHDSPSIGLILCKDANETADL